MSPGSAWPGPEPSRHPSHRAEPDPAGGSAGGSVAGEERDGAWFSVVLRGYDRGEVETRLADLDRRIQEEVRRAESAETALSAARAHVRRLQGQLETRTPTSPATSTPPSPAGSPTDDAGFGRRLERVLQAAEQEATALRDRAAADAEEIRERARAEAEAHRHRTEEALLLRAATLDREFTTRGEALDERERDVRSELDRARTEAAELRREAEQAAAERRTDVVRDVDRLSALRDEVRAELGRVQASLSAALDREPVDTTLDTAPDTALDDDLSGPSAVRDEDGAPEPPTGPGPGSAADEPGTGGEDTATGTLLLGPGRRPGRTDGPGPDSRPDPEETTIGRIPPISLASIGVLPFGDLAAGGDEAATRTDGANGASRGHRGPTRGPGPGGRSR